MNVKAPLALLALVVLSGFGCGKRKPPVPPTGRVIQRAEISGFQRGSQVILVLEDARPQRRRTITSRTSTALTFTVWPNR